MRKQRIGYILRGRFYQLYFEIMDKKVILAFSGGLDTSFCVVKLKEQGYSIVTVLVDTGGFDKNKVKEIERKAYRLGAYKHYTIYSDTDIYNNVIGYFIKTKETLQRQ